MYMYLHMHVRVHVVCSIKQIVLYRQTCFVYEKERKKPIINFAKLRHNEYYCFILREETFLGAVYKSH